MTHTFDNDDKTNDAIKIHKKATTLQLSSKQTNHHVQQDSAPNKLHRLSLIHCTTAEHRY